MGWFAAIPFMLFGIVYLLFRLVRLYQDFGAGVARLERRYDGEDLVICERAKDPVGFWFLTSFKLIIVLFLMYILVHLLMVL